MPIPDYTPGLSDVGAVLYTRTRNSAGEEVGTFNSDTEPTDTQVEALIASAVDDIEAEFGSDLPTLDVNGTTIDFSDRVKKLAALAAALQVELTYFPEQVAGNKSPYTQLKQQFDERLKRLQVQYEAAIGGTGDTGGEPGPQAQYNFPDVVQGWDSKRF